MPATSKIAFSDRVGPALYTVWNSIAPDVFDLPGGKVTNSVAIEMCVDANRPAEYGFPDVDAEIRDLVIARGYRPVLRALARRFRLV